MAWTPVNGLVPQYSTEANALAFDYWIKFYKAGTTTPFSAAINISGAPLLAKIKLNNRGMPITNPSDNESIFIPFVDQPYRVVLFKSEADADADNTGNAEFNVDAIPPNVAPLASIADISTKGTTLQVQDDYDRSPLFVDGEDFTAGVGPHVITVPAAWTPSNADTRFYKVDIAGIITFLTPTVKTTTTFTLAETLLNTDTIFIGDNKFRNQFDGDPADIRSRLSLDSVLLAEQNLSDVESPTLSRQNLDIKIEGWIVGSPVCFSDGRSLLVSGEDIAEGCAFNDDGTKYYMVGRTNAAVYEYDLSTPYDLDTGSYSGNSLSLSAQGTRPHDMYFTPDGTKLYTADNNESKVFRYNLSTPFDLDTALYSGQSLLTDVYEPDLNGLFLNDDGTKVYVVGGGSRVVSYDLSTPYDLNTGLFLAQFNNLTEDGDPTGIAFSNNGQRMIIAGENTDAIYSYVLKVKWDITSAFYDETSIDKLVSFSITGLTFSNDGSIFVTTGSNLAYSYNSHFLSVG